MLKEFRYAARVLLHTPLFTAVAALSLALGIGGAASVFTVLNAVLLRSLAIPNPQQLYAAETHRPGGMSPRYAWPVAEEARDQLKGRAELFAATTATGMQVRIAGRTDAAATDRGMIQLVSGEYFAVLRQQAQTGRLLAPADNASPAAHPVAVISDAYWTRRFNRSPDIVGREIIIGGASLTVVGVAGPRFFGPFLSMRNPDVWIPLIHQPAVRYAVNASMSDGDGLQPWAPQRTIQWLFLFARVPEASAVPGVASALTRLHRLDALTRASEPDDRQRVETERVLLESAGRGVSPMRGELSTPLVVLLAMVGVLLAVTCGNVASLLLARASAREREVAIRMAIGAGRWRVVRQQLVETVLLSFVGGGLGLIVAAWGRDALLVMFSGGATAIDLDTSFDWRVLTFALGVTILSGLTAGVLPALRSTQIAPTDALKAQARQVGGGGGRRGAFLGKALVVAQIAFCVLLLVLAGLFVRSMQSLLRTDVGFDRGHILVGRLDVRSLGFTNAQRQALYVRLIERLRRVPGVVGASLSLNGPLGTSQRSSSLSVEGYTPGPREELETNEEIITAGYFDTVGLRIVEGRAFTADDGQAGRRTSIINESMARRFFPSGRAIGKRWSYGDPFGPESPVIVGVVQDARYNRLRGSAPNMIYGLSAALPDDVLSNFEIRTSVAPEQLVKTVTQALAEAEPSAPVFDVVPLDVRLNRGIANDRLVAHLTSAFGIVALTLASLGLYGTISYGVARRVRELGVRMALGADRADVLWLVVREALVLVAFGAAIGLPLAFAASRSIASMLHGVRPIDPAAYAAGPLLLLVVATIAAYLPAHRASRIDPMAALRAE